MDTNKKWCLGKDPEGLNIYIRDFSWDCGWYWGGGYIATKYEHSHFSQFYKMYGTERGCNLFDGFKSRIKDSYLTDDQIWRLCDLMKQFYSHKESAECFKHGGHYTSKGRNKKEINQSLNKRINAHIEKVIIPEFHKLMDEIEKNGIKRN